MGVPWLFLTVHRGSKVGLLRRQACIFTPPLSTSDLQLFERTLSRKRSCSRLEHSPRQRAVPEGVLVPKEGCPRARIVLHPRVRAVHSIWQTERPFQQAGLTTPHRWGKIIRTAWHPSDRATTPSGTVRAHRRARCRRPAAAVARTQRPGQGRPSQGCHQVR